MAKVIQFFENSPDNFHCLQACIKSLLSYYFPEKKIIDKEIDNKTIQVGGWSWLPPSGVWLDDMGLDVKLYSEFNYEAFSVDGEAFLKKTFSEERYLREKNNGSFNNLSSVQEISKEMIRKKLWINQSLGVDQLKDFLYEQNTFAIGKTYAEWLSGNYLGHSSHYVLVINEYAPGKWRIHDPGYPGTANRKVEQLIANHNIFNDILIIRK